MERNSIIHSQHLSNYDIFEVGLCSMNKEQKDLFYNSIPRETNVLFFRRTLKKDDTSHDLLKNIVNSRGMKLLVRSEDISKLQTVVTVGETVQDICSICNAKKRITTEKACAQVCSNPFNDEPEDIYLCSDCSTEIYTELQEYLSANYDTIVAKCL